MTPQDDPVPTREEVSRQLERILKSQRFAAASTAAPFMELIVNANLAGKDLDEDEIGFALFPKRYRPDESTDVRVNARNLRERLRRYYADEGQDDVVVISLPEPPKERRVKAPSGQAYRPSYSYNPRSEVARHYQRGLFHLGQFSVFPDVRFAVQSFEAVLRLQPEHAGAHAALAEAHVLSALCNHAVKPAHLLESADASAREAIRLDNAAWSAHLVLGFTCLCRRQWNDAHQAFTSSLAIAPREAGKHPLYAAYLLALGRRKDVSRIADAIVRRNPAEPMNLAVAGLLLYGAREFQTAHVLLLQTIVNNPMSCWLTHLVFACLDLALGRHFREAAPGAFRAAQRLVDLAPEQPILFPGLEIVCLAAGNAADTARVREEFAYLQKRARETHVTHLQLALAFMALGNAEDAINSLVRAQEESEPWLAWLHVLPLFDPLKEVSAFREIAARITPSDSGKAKAV